MIVASLEEAQKEVQRHVRRQGHDQWSTLGSGGSDFLEFRCGQCGHEVLLDRRVFLAHPEQLIRVACDNNTARGALLGEWVRTAKQGHSIWQMRMDGED